MIAFSLGFLFKIICLLGSLTVIQIFSKKRNHKDFKKSDNNRWVCVFGQFNVDCCEFSRFHCLFEWEYKRIRRGMPGIYTRVYC